MFGIFSFFCCGKSAEMKKVRYVNSYRGDLINYLSSVNFAARTVSDLPNDFQIPLDEINNYRLQPTMHRATTIDDVLWILGNVSDELCEKLKPRMTHVEYDNFFNDYVCDPLLRKSEKCRIF